MVHAPPGTETQKVESWARAHSRTQGEGNVNVRAD